MFLEVSKLSQVLWMAAALDVVTFARAFLEWTPNAAQEQVLRGLPNFRQAALNCSRQWGKSTVAAVWVVHRLWFVPGATVLIVGPSQKQSGETLRKVRYFLAVMGVRTKSDGLNRHSAVLPNGSRVVALPANEVTARGFSAVSMLIVDEASRVEDELFGALMPCLATTNGDVMVMSTPKGKRGRFYEVMTEGERWLRHTGPVTECERIPVEFLVRERARGESFYRQEYLCEFIENWTYLVDEGLVRRAVKGGEEVWREV